MVGVLRPKADDRRIVVIEALSAFVSVRQLQAFFTPYPLDFLVIDGPALGPQKFADLAITVAAILLGQPDQGQTQVVPVPESCFVTQGAARNPENLAGSPLGCPKLLAGLDNSRS